MFILSYSIDVFKKRTNNQNFVFVSVEKLENDGVCVCDCGTVSCSHLIRKLSP